MMGRTAPTMRWYDGIITYYTTTMSVVLSLFIVLHHGEVIQGSSMTERVKVPAAGSTMVVSKEDIKRRLEMKKSSTSSYRMERQRPLRIRHVSIESAMKQQRQLQTPCDAAFLSCLPDEGCLSCFEQLGAQDINWAGVQSATPCTDVVKMLTDAGHCDYLIKTDDASRNSQSLFCDTFNSCVMWDDNNDAGAGGGSDDDEYSTDDDFDAIDVKCDELTKCEWDGMHENFLGDGICQRFGCYNHKICNYDYGDCCDDTCIAGTYADCGVDGYQCKDPSSKNCEQWLNKECKGPETLAPKPTPVCQFPEKLYSVREYDSWGDGWDQTRLNITDESNAVVFTGKLENGFEGVESICLRKGCYTAIAAGGVWGVEVSWDIRPASGGAVLASGGSPMNCTFPIGGSECDNTCLGKQLEGGEKQVSQCITDKCVLQLGACNNDPDDCSKCLEADSPSYCFTNDAYNALVDCAICQCMDEPPEYCETMKPGTGNGKGGTSGSTSNTCSAKEILDGSSAVLGLAKCANIDSVQTMVEKWDNDLFGTLDDFEACAHTYNDSKGKSSKSALDCMNMLYEIVSGETKDPDYVVALAKNIYEQSEDMCDCSTRANKLTPSCQAFFRVKTYLYETLDACTALDEIDCAAWEDFARPCKDNMKEKFTNIDFTKTEQCEYIHDQCGGVGAFPAFRHLDCGKEISRVAWDFYDDFSKSCLKKDDSKKNTTSAPTKAPTAPASNPTTPSGGGATPTTPISPVEPPASSPSSDGDNNNSSPVAPPTSSNKEYVPPKGRDPLEPSENKKKSPIVKMFFIFIVAAAGTAGVFYYKQHYQDMSASYMGYRRQRQDWDDDGLDTELFGSTGHDNNGMGNGSFEPPSLTVSRGGGGGNMT